MKTLNQAIIRFHFDPALAPGGRPSAINAHLAGCLQNGEDGDRTGCGSCQELAEKHIRSLPGVDFASAKFENGSLTLHYRPTQADTETIIRKVAALNAGLTPEASATPSDSAPRPGRTLRAAWTWLLGDTARIYATAVTFVAMIAGLVSHAWLSAPLAGNIAYILAYIAGGFYGGLAGVRSLRNRSIDVDLLMILAAIGAAIVGAPFEGAMLLFLFSLSNVLQKFALKRTSSAIRSLMDLRPQVAQVYLDDKLVRLPVERIRIGDRVAVRPGERIPLDGTILEGETTLDQSPITGESIPVEKQPGDKVLAGTINQLGSIEVRVTHLAKDSTIARLIALVSEAQSEKARTQRFIDRAEQYYAGGVIAMTVVAILLPILLLGEDFNSAFYRGMSLMVAASPCAVVISTPATVLSAVGNAARRGVLFKGGAHVEITASIKVVAFDKTGTLTVGKPELTDVLLFEKTSSLQHEDDLLRLTASVEQKSEHPLAQAIVSAAREAGLDLDEAGDFLAIPGKGVSAKLRESRVQIGNLKYFEESDTAGTMAAQEALRGFLEQGKTSILVAVEGRLVGALALADQLREGVPAVMQALKNQGVIKTLMLTGDHQRVGRQIAAQAGLDGFYADLMPEEKLDIIRKLEREYGPVAMVGDGVNDAPALAAASLGIAMGAAGTDVALETADIVLMGDNLGNIPYLFELSRATRKTLVQNLVFAMGVIVALIGGVLGFQLALPLSVIGHEGSTVLVSLNGIRLLGFRRQGEPA